MYMRCKTTSDTIALTLFYAIPLVVHTLGIYLLLKVKKNRFYNPTQRIYLINLSISEILVCVLKMLHRVFFLFGYKKISDYIDILQTSGAFLHYMLIMCLLTVDRFLEVYLNLKYPVFWNKQKTLISLIISMVLSLLLALAVCILYWKNHPKSLNIASLYIWSSSEFGFLVIAVITYTYILKKLYKKRKPVSITKEKANKSISIQCLTDNKKELQILEKRRKKVFYLPAFLIMSFLLFWVVPDMIDFYHAITDKTISVKLNIVINVCYIIAITSDAFIYVFTLEFVRKRTVKFFCRRY